MSSPYDVPIVRFAITVAPTPPRKEGAAPERFYLATSGGAYEVTLPEDAWSHPGESYEVALPEPIQTSCVAIVLGDAFTRGKTHPEVTIAELTAYSAFDRPGATRADVASALKGDPERANIAAALLERAGPAGLAAVSAVYPELDAAGRALAVNVAASNASCVTSAPLLVAALGDADEVVRAKAEAKLHEATCGREALPALEAGLASGGARSRVAPVVAFIGREAALGALGDVLGQGSPDDRHAVRAAAASAARNASPEAVRAVLVRARERSANANLDALRALALRVNDARDAADANLSALFVANPPLDVRYLLVDVLASLADAGDTKDSTRRSELALHDPSSDVRAHAAESIVSAADAEVRDATLHDASPRVREAAIHAVSLGKDTRLTSSLADLVNHDPWSFVRAAAAEGLAGLPGSAESWRALADALHQRSPKVREQAILSLGASDGRSYREAIRDRLDDTKEELAVRLAAATALGKLCDPKAVDDLAKLALRGGSSPDSDDVALGLVATAALGQIHPKNLESRFAPLRSKDVRPDARAAAAQAMANARPCEALP